MKALHNVDIHWLLGGDGIIIDYNKIISLFKIRFIKLINYKNSQLYSSNSFRFKSGTKQSFAGYPTGKSNISFSCDGRSNNVRKAGPQFNGVDVSETKPAY